MAVRNKAPRPYDASQSDVDTDALWAAAGQNVSPDDLPPGFHMIDIDKIVPDPTQPRRDFDQSEIAELVESIEAHGLLQPVVVRPIASWHKGKPQAHVLIFGERRWQAAQQTKLTSVPAIIRDVDKKTALELQLTENTQRVSLKPKEFADGCKRLMTEFNLTLREVSRRLGKGASTISTLIKVVDDPALMRAVEVGNITYTQAQELVALENRAKMQLVKEIVKHEKTTGQTVTVPQVRAMAREVQPAKKGPNVPNRNVITARSETVNPYTPRKVEPIATRIRQGVVHLRYAADVAESGYAETKEYDEALQEVKNARGELDRIEAALTAKARRKAG